VLFARWVTYEFDIEVDALVGQVRPLGLPVIDNEQQAVIGEQRNVVVDGPVVTVKILGIY
jgi:hypothetical protein